MNKTTLIGNVYYDICPCCGKPKRGTGKSMGGVVVWVLKSFVKSGKLVDFPHQWQAVCEAAGFETVHIHHAMLVKTKGTQIDMDGKHHTKTIERKSFFRRLSEGHAQAAEFWKDVSRDAQAKYLMAVRSGAWEHYHWQIEHPDELHPPIKPTRSRNYTGAKMMAWFDAGKPVMQAATRIDYECVLCMVKP